MTGTYRPKRVLHVTLELNAFEEFEDLCRKHGTTPTDRVRKHILEDIREDFRDYRPLYHTVGNDENENV